MLFGDRRSTQKASRLGYGTATKARKTLRFLRSKSRGEQVRGAQTMYYRGFYHANQTADMRAAMKVYAAFLKSKGIQVRR